MKELFEIVSSSLTIIDLIDILLVSLLFYLLFSLLKGARSSVALRGLVTILFLSLLIYFLAMTLNLKATVLLIERFWLVAVLVFLIVFQHEFRRVLTEIGQMKIFRHLFSRNSGFLEEVLRSILVMSNRKIGALIVFERRNSLRVYADTGTAIDSEVNTEMIRTIFSPYAPLHDGAMIIRNDRIVAAGCILPLTSDPNVDKELGTRHRAAIGLTEENDSVAVAVSEETGIISLATRGELSRGESIESLRKKLEDLLDIKSEEENAE